MQKFWIRTNRFSGSLQTLFFFIAAIVALASAIPAPASNNAPAAPQPIEPQESKVESEQLEAGEEEKDLKASQSIGYGYYGYPYSSGYYGGYYPYSYR